MHKMTQENLEAAFAGESQAHMKYLIFADKAEQEGLPNVARLFRAVAYAEQVHATNHFKALKNLGKTEANLEAALGGETYEIEEMYPAFLAVAELQEEKDAIRSNNWAMEAEKVHAEFYAEAKSTVATGNDPEVEQIHVCTVCGWTGKGEPPDRCPLCGASIEKFKKL